MTDAVTSQSFHQEEAKELFFKIHQKLKLMNNRIQFKNKIKCVKTDKNLESGTCYRGILKKLSGDKRHLRKCISILTNRLGTVTWYGWGLRGAEGGVGVEHPRC